MPLISMKNMSMSEVLEEEMYVGRFIAGIRGFLRNILTFSHNRVEGNNSDMNRVKVSSEQDRMAAPMGQLIYII